MPNPTKEQLKQKLKDLKEEVADLKEENEELKMLANTPDAFEKKNIRVQLHGGTVKELLED